VLLTISLVMAGLSTGQKLGIAAAGAVFIVFALVCSLVVPNRNPNFPGRHVGWYIVVVACFVIGMLAVVLTLGKEKPEASAATTPTTSSVTTTATTTSPTVQGDPVAGKKVFETAGCTACHTLKAAGSTGTVGPNLDQLKPAEAVIVHQVEVGGGPMPAFKDQLTPKQIQDVAAFVYTSTH
jgi:mono/diheme cytochrome c family protein